MSDIFTNEDLDILAKTMRLRERIVDNTAKLPDDQLPRKPSELLAIVSLTESMDRSILPKAKRSIDKEHSDDAKATKQVVRQLMIDLHENRPAKTDSGTVPAYQPREDMHIAPGELVPKMDNVVLYETET